MIACMMADDENAKLKANDLLKAVRDQQLSITFWLRVRELIWLSYMREGISNRRNVINISRMILRGISIARARHFTNVINIDK